jgi:hypothetical protein
MIRELPVNKRKFLHFTNSLIYFSTRVDNGRIEYLKIQGAGYANLE